MAMAISASPFFIISRFSAVPPELCADHLIPVLGRTVLKWLARIVPTG
jgi:hypothetical protein